MLLIATPVAHLAQQIFALVALKKTFTTTGFHDWKHAMGSKGMLLITTVFLISKQLYHEQFRATSKTKSVANQLGSNRTEQIKKNRHYIKMVAEVLLHCSRQEISFWEHDESSESLTNGNCKESLSLLTKHDPVVAEKSYGPRNALCTSLGIQNNIMANKVRQQICTSIQQAGYYSTLADKTKDE